MTTLAPSARRLVLADRVFPRTLLMNIVLVVAGAGLTTVLAQLAIPMWPVPITGQTFAVLFVGATLGTLRGALSMLLYALLGIVGLPVFTQGSHGLSVLAGPTGGYIIGFILAAAAVGWLASREWDRKWLRTIVALLVGTVIIYAIGLPWLYVVLSKLGVPDTLNYTLQHGLYVFIIGDVIKAVLAGVILPVTWYFLNKRKSTTQS